MSRRVFEPMIRVVCDGISTDVLSRAAQAAHEVFERTGVYPLTARNAYRRRERMASAFLSTGDRSRLYSLLGCQMPDADNASVYDEARDAALKVCRQEVGESLTGFEMMVVDERAIRRAREKIAKLSPESRQKVATAMVKILSHSREKARLKKASSGEA